MHENVEIEELTTDQLSEVSGSQGDGTGTGPGTGNHDGKGWLRRAWAGGDNTGGPVYA
jgi:hypothetical protein